MISLLAQATDSNAPAFFFGLGAFGLILALLAAAFWPWMLVDAPTNRSLDPTMKIVWASVIFFFPVLGGLHLPFRRAEG